MNLRRNFKLLFAGRAASYIGSCLAPIAVAFAILMIGSDVCSTAVRTRRRIRLDVGNGLPSGRLRARRPDRVPVVGMRGYLLFGAGWLVASTIVLTRTPAIRDFAYDDEVVEPAVSPA